MEITFMFDNLIFNAAADLFMQNPLGATLVIASALLYARYTA
jgi:hypothetical protein